MAKKKTVIEEVIENPEEEVVETKSDVKEAVKVEPEKKRATKGTVKDCERLFVRTRPNKNGGVASVIIAGTRVNVDLENSTDDFYKVSVNGVEGFCMKQFIKMD